jgi:hypothetical protein
MGRYHHLPVLRLIEHGGTMEGKVGGMQEATVAGITTIKSGAPGTTTITIPVLRHVETREVQGELPSSGGQETMLPPGLTIVFSLPTACVPIDISPDSTAAHSSHSSHPSTGLTLSHSAYEALAMAHLE